ncbi:hypothetical protein HDK77DRAFT_267721 [Phyllosticta capitalensis]
MAIGWLIRVADAMVVKEVTGMTLKVCGRRGDVIEDARSLPVFRKRRSLPGLQVQQSSVFAQPSLGNRISYQKALNMQGLWIFLTALLVAFAAAQPPDPECNKFGKCRFFSGYKKISDLGKQNYKDRGLDKVFKNCIKLCLADTTDGTRHPGWQSVAWLENDGCYCAFDLPGDILNPPSGFPKPKKGPTNCRVSDITCSTKKLKKT